jgi:uncharacterized protein YqhQ
VACRTPSRAIEVERFDLPVTVARHPILKRPFLRGCYVLGESLYIGIRALMISANHALEEEDAELSDKQMGWTLGVAMVLFAALFIVLPVVATKGISAVSGGGVADRAIYFNLVEGALRIGLFVGYLLLISRFDDIRRTFQYHGAEHKTIYAYENGDDLIPEEIDARYPTLHVRCGTNFLFIVLFLAIVTNFLIDVFWGGSFGPRVALRLLAIPVLAGLSYEVIKLASRNEDSLLFRITMLPGLALQKITTKPPSLDMIEVAIAAMRAVAPPEYGGAALQAEAEAAGGSPSAPVA